MTKEPASSICASKRDRAGHVVLDQPASLNALGMAMITELRKQLEIWRDDDSVKWVILEGNGGKAFCAGADVRATWQLAVSGQYDAIDRYFTEEYALDLLIARYPKPVIAFVDGICFGGGMALAVHSRYCVATETASFSMPETLIGFFPDAGATCFLPRLPRALGLYLGLTGARLNGADAVRLELASHFIPHASYNSLLQEAIYNGPEILGKEHFSLPSFSLDPCLDRIERCFNSPSLADIFLRIEREAGPWANETLAILHARSPASLEWTFESLRSSGATLEACLQNELALVAVATRHPDFREGIRAALVDKDKSPKWQNRDM